MWPEFGWFTVHNLDYGMNFMSQQISPWHKNMDGNGIEMPTHTGPMVFNILLCYTNVGVMQFS